MVQAFRRTNQRKTKWYNLLEGQIKAQNKNFASTMKDFGMVRKNKEVQNIKFVVSGGTYDPTMRKPMLQHPKEHQRF